MRYCFGTDDPESLDALKRVLRSVFPDTYELETTTCPTNTLQSITPDTNTTDLAAVEYLGTAERPTDWQIRLTSFDDFHTEDQHDVHRDSRPEPLKNAFGGFYRIYKELVIGRGYILTMESALAL